MATIIQIKGVVQGVGFRPYVWKLATSLGLKGFVRNDSNGVYIRIEGGTADRFLKELKSNPPPLSKITGVSVTVSNEWKNPAESFQILESEGGTEKAVQISPDVSVCGDCQRELFDESDRRYRYPFINCVHCGPRYSIIKGLPYDRPNTSMAGFELCADCAREYADPANRRYHAQPVACPVCGPQLRFCNNVEAASSRFITRQDAASTWEEQWVEAIHAGKIVAVKGIGGFHLVCDALNADAVAELRRRKARENKPFALMVPDLDWVRETCELSEAEEKLLTSRERPIVILRLKVNFATREAIAPNLNTLGVMLPYTPMHLILFDLLKRPLVMTSANYSSEPMIHTNEDALQKLSGLADEFLLHDRDIVNRCDDSVCAVYSGQTIVLRPGRGMAPVSFPVGRVRRTRRGRLGEPSLPCVLGIGADMKNTFAVAHDGWITLSPYIGDLENPETQEILKTSIRRHLDCYDLKPELIVHDLHPDYFSTRIAEEFASPEAAVQHHHAHCIAAAVEHGIEGRAIGIAFDGTGYGSDGTIWGGEILEFDSRSFERKFYLKPFALPGGEKAVKEPKRTLVSILSNVEEASSLFMTRLEASSTLKILESGINCPMTSSMGRLFDAASVLLGACELPTFDGEGPMRLEAMADLTEKGYFSFKIEQGQIDWRPMFREMFNIQHPISNIQYPISREALAARFHNTVAEIIFACIQALPTNLPVVFSGGVFQNRFLVEGIKKHPAFDQRRMFFSSYPNDSAVALGQAAFGISNIEQGTAEC